MESVCGKSVLHFMIILSGNENTLVEFADEGSSAVVPLSQLSGVDVMFLKEGQHVEVVWNAGKKYKAQILMLGKQLDDNMRIYRLTIICQ